MPEELKPCPFCGCAAVLKDFPSTWEISCSNCRLSLWSELRYAAVEFWNRRAESPATPKSPILSTGELYARLDMEPPNERERQEIKESHEALRAQYKALSAALETARKALEDICAASARRFSQDAPPAELQSMRDHDSGARLAWSAAAKIARSALAALDAATKPVVAGSATGPAVTICDHGKDRTREFCEDCTMKRGICGPVAPASECDCQRSDAWRCARLQRLAGQIACECQCHRVPATKSE